MHEIYLKNLSLKNYRNFDNFEISINNNPIVIIGDNGSGKTNILEAITLFFPGRGLRGAKLEHICRNGNENWHVSSLINSTLKLVRLSTNFNLTTQKRTLEFNGAKIPNNELSKITNMIWLTPQMDGIFLDSASSRRKFFDRIVYNFISSHAEEVSKYEYYIGERIKILLSEIIDENWLKIIEEKIALVSINIATNRIKVLSYLQNALNEMQGEFPKATLTIEGKIEEKISLADISISEFIQDRLVKERHVDRLTKRTSFGVHKSDLQVIHTKKNQLAKFCSTGEQKAMLVSILIAQILSIIKITNTKPIVLLDEVFIHLDEKRKQELIEFFLFLNLQIWVTSTDLNGIEKLASHAEIIKLKTI